MAVSSHKDQAGGKLPRGPSGLTSEQVAEDQRQRLIEAIVHLTGKHGYAQTTVAEIIARAEVSRKTFYTHFLDTDGLLLAAFDATSPIALEELRMVSRRTGGPTRQMEAVTRCLSRQAQASPEALVLSTVQIAAVDPAGLERRDRLMGDFGELIDGCLSGEGQLAFPPALARSLAGGIHRTINAYIEMGRSTELAALAPALARWTRSYAPLQVNLLSRDGIVSKPLAGGRAPGTLTLAPRGYLPPRGKQSSALVQHSNRERILDAVAQLVATHGYLALNARAIAERADISERAFLAHFKSKDEAFTAALEIGHMKAQALVERARFEATNWSTGVRNGVSALLEFLACEPYFTRIAFIDAPLAGPKMMKRTHEHTKVYARLLLEGAPQRRRPPNVAPEAIAHGIFELVFHHAAQNKVQELLQVRPIATYLAIAPFIGVSEAADAAVT